jgi:hypothetical protein
MKVDIVLDSLHGRRDYALCLRQSLIFEMCINEDI